MQKVKWLFFGYLAFVLLTVGGIAAAFHAAPPRDPNTFYATYSGAIKSLDPAEVNDTLGSGILSYIFEALYNYKYNRLPYEIVPELASDMPVVSADGLTMTIHVRPGIHYYDPEKTLWPDGVGPEVTADDFVYSFKRVCDFNLASDNYSFVFQGHFAGLDDWWNYTKAHPNGKVDYDRPVQGFSAPDHRTLVLRFTHPYPQMIYNLVNCPTSPVCRPIAERWGDQVRLHPVGTGPYALAENLREERIVLTANPSYRGAPDLPHIKRVQLDYFIDEMPVWLLFQQGLFDVGGIPKDAYSQAIGGGGNLTPEMVARGVVLRKHTDPATNYIGFNMTDPVLGKNRPLRQAMSMAFNRARFIEKFANGRGVPAIGPIPPGFPTYDPNRINPYTQFNLAGARKLMRQAVAINNGPIPPLQILFRGADTIDRQMADFYVDLMNQIGVTLVPEYRDFARWQEMVDNHQAQIFDGGWDADYPDEQDFLQLFYGPNGGPDGLNNVAYENPAFDALYDKAAAMQDTPQRRALYMRMEKMVEEDCPWLIIDYGVTFDLSYNWVGNRFFMDYGHGYMQYVTLDKQLRAKRLATGHLIFMLAYLVRKFLLTLWIIFGVMVVTFLLFNFVAKDPARAFAGKDVSPAQLEAIRHKMGLDKSKFRQFVDIMTFQFPQSMRYQESVWKLFAAKAPISLAIQGPAFVIGLGMQFAIAIIVASRRNSISDYSATALAVLMMSLPSVSVYLGVQWLFGAKLMWFPIAGWAPGFIFAIHFAALPILVSVVGGLGGGVRFYRTVALEEINTDYVRTARAKGVSRGNVLLVHVFRNMLIPVVTQTIVAIPFLVTGSLVLETMFQIPGFGGLLNDSLHATDSPVVMAVVYLTSIAYALMLFATDICYTLVDPRVTLR